MLRREARFDLVLDLSAVPLIDAHQKPHGYFAPGAERSRHRRRDRATWPQMIGEFEKPKYFRYKERLCAHSRNRQAGCTACIDICSARAIASAGDLVARQSLPVRRLRRLHHRVPERARWPTPTRARPTPASACAPCWPTTPARAASTR